MMNEKNGRKSDAAPCPAQTTGYSTTYAAIRHSQKNVIRIRHIHIWGGIL